MFYPGQASSAPPLQQWQKLKAEIHRKIVEMLDLSRLSRWGQERLRKEVRKLAHQLVETVPQCQAYSPPDKERLVNEILDEVFGLGPLEPLMNDPTISDILVNGPNTVYVERNGRLEQVPICFADNEHLMQMIQRIVARVGRRLDEMSPMVDARLPDGSRVNAIAPPLALDGPVLSIRRFGVRLTAEDLIQNGTMPVEFLALLRAAVEARISMVISGGAGTGKTTLLNVLSRYIPPEERLITIEDSAELKLQQPHVVRLETRPPNLEGVGEVRQRDLVRNALRMRPDRIIIGECRGPEALDMLQAMNTGHEGSLTTVHANDTRDALARLEMMVMMAGYEMPITVIRQYIASAITFIVHLTRLKGGARKVTRISELVGLRNRNYVVRDIFGFRQYGVRNGVAYGEFYATGKIPRCLERVRAAGIELPESLFAKRTIPAEFEIVQTSPVPEKLTERNELEVPH
ncbi:MAG: CpaF family protein [Gemmatales bacterium]|nr:CpaF family protein [Gemmatales bacterium]MDW7994473.1 CpaF family protein [Gemmatales bacterium]